MSLSNFPGTKSSFQPARHQIFYDFETYREIFDKKPSIYVLLEWYMRLGEFY